MRFLLFFVGILITAAFGMLVIGGNGQLVIVRIPLFLPIEVELWKVMLGGVGLGAAVALAFDAAGRIRRLVRERRLRRGQRDFEEGDRLFREGVEEMASGRFEKALLSLQAAEEYAGADRETLRRKAECLMRLDRFGEATTALEQAAEEDRGDHRIAYALAEARMANGQPGRARDLLEQTIAEDAEPPASALGRFRDLLTATGDDRGALQVQQRLLSVTPGSGRLAEERRAVALRHTLGLQLLRAGEAVEAARVFRAVLEEDPGAAPAWVRLGQAYRKAGNERAAVEAWQRGFTETRAMAPLTALQDYYLDRTCPEDAITVWKRAIAETRSMGGTASHQSRYLLGKLYDRLFMLDEAAEALAGLAGSGSPAVSARLTRILESRGDLAGAVVRARQAISSAPTLVAEYACSQCGARRAEWSDACAECASFGTVALELGAPRSAAEAEAAAATPVV